MNVRSFQLSDYATVNELLQKVLSETCYEETIEAFARQLSWDSGLVLVAVLNGEIVGIIIGTIDNKCGYYYRIAVDSSHQRKGIGKLLIQSLKRRFNMRKVSKILITMDAHNEPIVPLYKSLGFQNSDFMRSLDKIGIVSG